MWTASMEACPRSHGTLAILGDRRNPPPTPSLGLFHNENYTGGGSVEKNGEGAEHGGFSNVREARRSFLTILVTPC